MFSLIARRYLIAVLLGAVVGSQAESGGAEEGPTDAVTQNEFRGQAEPFLTRHCADCHGPDVQEAEFRVDRLAFNPTTAESQAAWRRVVEMIQSGEMPPEDAEHVPDTEHRVAFVRQVQAWLPRDNRADEHWAFQPLSQPAGDSVDSFVEGRLAKAGLRRSPRAQPRRLLRRVYLDLIGLPPPPEALEAFAADPSPAHYGRIVDELLARPEYGERWGRHWLDLARYADSNGLHEDRDRPHAWRYRDYVIASFNADKPYGQFIREQLAGDELRPDDPQAWIATGFCRNGPSNDENIAENALEEYRLDQLDNILATTSQVFLGQTIQCARCHNHKLEPFTLADYYRLSAVFKTAVPAFVPLEKNQPGKPQQVVPRPRDRRQPPKKPHIRALTDAAAKPRTTRILLRGNLQTPGEVVTPGVPGVLERFDVPFAAQPTAQTTGRRAALAAWIASPNNPLTWRVMANRLWQYHFGAGLVTTPNNFGLSGAAPSHPELLDWLACELRDRGGRLKPLHKLIVTSHTYQQSSAHNAEAAAVDPDDRLLWRYRPHRLEAEVIRDGILAASRRLNPARGGPGMKPRLPAELLEQSKRNSWPKVSRETPEHWRRSVYIYIKRQLPLPLLSLFDLPDATQSCAMRFASTTPTQSLALLNDAFVNEQARFLAEDVAAAEDRGAVARLVERVWCVEPSAAQLARMEQFVTARTKARQSQSDARLAALADLAVVLFNSSQFVYVD